MAMHRTAPILFVFFAVFSHGKMDSVMREKQAPLLGARADFTPATSLNMTKATNQTTGGIDYRVNAGSFSFGAKQAIANSGRVTGGSMSSGPVKSMGNKFSSVGLTGANLKTVMNGVGLAPNEFPVLGTVASMQSQESMTDGGVRMTIFPAGISGPSLGALGNVTIVNAGHTLGGQMVSGSVLGGGSRMILSGTHGINS
jgi:hypothetical protein